MIKAIDSPVSDLATVYKHQIEALQAERQKDHETIVELRKELLYVNRLLERMLSSEQADRKIAGDTREFTGYFQQAKEHLKCKS